MKINPTNSKYAELCRARKGSLECPDWVKVTVFQRVYKNSMNSGPIYNVYKDDDKTQLKWVYLDQVDWYYANENPTSNVHSVRNFLVDSELSNSKTYDTHVVHVPRSEWKEPEVQLAMQKELKNFTDFDVYDLVKDEGQQTISSGWVIIRKMKQDEQIVKARLVIHGNQEVEAVRSDSPTVSKQSLRIQFTMAAQNNWKMHSADVTAAFLQAKPLDRKIFVRPVQEAGHQGMLWSLKRPMYGLDDSGRQWYLTLSEFLQSRQCRKLDTDWAVYYLHVEGELHGIVTIHVDDLQYCGSDYFHSKVIKPMLEKFKFGEFNIGDFKCLGWKLHQNEKEIIVSQREYIEKKLSKVEINTANREPKDELNSDEKTI